MFEPDEPVCRFLFSSDDIDGGGRVRGRAFMPARDGTASVFRFRGLNTEARIDHGKNYVGDRGERPFHGFAEVAAAVVSESEVGLEVEEPPPLHAIILGWPDDREAKKAIAQLIASKAMYVPRSQ